MAAIFSLSGIYRASPGGAPVNIQQASFAPLPPSEGDTVEVDDGQWSSNTPIDYTYQWQLGSVDIIGATLKTLLILPTMVGSSLRCVVTATNLIGSSSSLTTNESVEPESQIKRLILIGDSTTYGVGGTISGTQSAGGANINSPAQLIAKYFNEQNIQSSAKSFVGTGGNGSVSTAAEYYDGNPDMNIELNGWDQLDTNTIGGELFQGEPGSGILKFTISGVDKGAIGIPRRIYGICEYRVDGGDWIEVNQNTNPDGSMERFDIDFGSVGTHTVEIQHKSGDTIYLNYVETWNSSDKLVVVPWGARGYGTGQLISTNRPWDYTPALSSVPFDAVLINIGINDIRNGGYGISEANYITRVKEYINSVRVANPNAKIILCIPNDISTGLSYIPSALTAIAIEEGVELIDARNGDGMASYGIANASGKMKDALHPSIDGYSAIYDYLSPLIKGFIYSQL